MRSSTVSTSKFCSIPIRIAAAMARVRPAGPRTSASGLAMLRRRSSCSRLPGGRPPSVSPETNSAALRPDEEHLYCSPSGLPILVGGDLRATPGGASAGRWLREIFVTRTIPPKFSRPRGGTPAPSCRRDSPLPAGEKIRVGNYRSFCSKLPSCYGRFSVVELRGRAKSLRRRIILWRLGFRKDEVRVASQLNM